MATKDITDIQVLRACERRTEHGAVHTLHEATGQHPNVCFRALERACHRGLLDYGVSLNRAFLTPEGEALLNSQLNEDPACRPPIAI